MVLQDLYLIRAALVDSERAKLSGKGWKDLEIGIKKTSLLGDRLKFLKCWDNFWAVKDRVVIELVGYHLAIKLTSEFVVHHNQKLWMIDSFKVLYEYVIFEKLWKFSNIAQNLVRSVDFCKRLKLLPNNWKIIHHSDSL